MNWQQRYATIKLKRLQNWRVIRRKEVIMAITVRDILSLQGFQHALVAAGQDGFI